MPKKRYKIEYDPQACIGAGPCAAVSPEQWYLDEQRKAHAKGGIKNKATGHEILECDEAELDEHMNAAVSCPVQVIKIFDQETGKQLV
ncbi:MAG: hypothetical protein A3F54_02975 [Candidatus Kerfeldbacteria bacterium RIFCSPHIGHO2_12_FULL_48_17]|uniref:4Fe-4S ferredoxin-type domain-containing protein n=1 Tax=Candidatus Kerfeldbacteria bacterium RIFCSPHIGHO2_12_FULL_48_17 TaxID=1798542 RepID=A0A1G2BAP3_9BACT|nr:MAG: hypothetical protein A3F54_02975 [Candidatus Kerfeldbacteria bacterium RIFCSPHIGHO2_12_FULL_48_17]